MPLRIIAACAVCLCLQLLAAEVVPGNGTATSDDHKPAPAAPKKSRFLVLTQSMGYTHAVVTRPKDKPGELSIVENALTDMAAKSGDFEVECIQDATLISAEKLKQLDGLIFFTSGDLPIKPAVFSTIQEWLRSGKAFVGIHSATDTFKEYRPYFDLVGATYLRHPWNHGAVVNVLDREHAAVKMFPAEFEWKEELCEQNYFEPKKVRVLLALDMSRSSPKLPKLAPICWVRDYGKGRVFYTNFGNSETAWSDELFRAHLLGGIRWTLKLDSGSAEPNPDISAKEEIKSRLAVLDMDKPWLTRAAKTAKAAPAIALATAEKLAREDKAAFLKLHDNVQKASADEVALEAHLKKNQKPREADIKAVQARRIEIINSLLPKVEALK